MDLKVDTHFRPDIQGLRGVSVLLVVLYHTKLAAPGGYLGVDIFFVISGFVITQMLLREIEIRDTIDIGAFFARRIKRILPALCVVSCFTLFLSVLILSPFGDQQKAISGSRATTLFYANFHFLLSDSYTQLTHDPFRQMWSLSIEEQFYLVFPFLLIVFNKLSRKLTGKLTSYYAASLWAFVAFLSLSLRYFQNTTQETWLSNFFQRNLPLSEFNFYLPSHRIWEFIFGVITASIFAKSEISSRLKSGYLSLFGLSLVFFSAMFFTDEGNFYGLNYIFACIGAVFIIFGNSGITTKFLTMKPLAWLGEISFSLYLWHWPIFVYLVILYPDAGPFSFGLACIVSVMIARVSYRVVETPFRLGTSSITNKTLAVLSLAILLPLTISGLQQASIPFQKSAYDTYDYTNNRKELASQKLGCADSWLRTELIDRCTILSQQSKGSMLLMGDSQAESFSDGVLEAGSQLNLNTTLFTFASCPALNLNNKFQNIACPSYEEKVKFINKSRPTYLVLSSGFTPYLEDDNCPLRENNECSTNRSDRVDDWFNSFRLLVDDMTAFRQKTVFIVQLPYLGNESSELSLIGKALGKSTLKSNQLTMSAQENFENRIRDVVSSSRFVRVIYPSSVICKSNTCNPVTKTQRGWFRDSGHLSKSGSLQLVQEIKKAIQSLSS